ncbi:MAG: hypothetical protein A2V85_09325 [Chloroflexi bacterium RBG_16_72_14]|nr:MAG: hypothetical protein A2V85_09325 [Chloroflexi bacterium RBG_16_72_14]
MSFDTFWSDLLSGVVVAGAAGLIALGIAGLVTRKLEERRARQARNGAAAEEFHRAYGMFFGAWKTWAVYRRDTGSDALHLDEEQWVSILREVTFAEGALESFLVRLTLEQPLSDDALLRLWCFRTGYKQLRYAVRQRVPLGWRRSDGPDPSQHAGFRQYRAFKALASDVAALLADAVDLGRERPSQATARSNLLVVTATDAGDLADRIGLKAPSGWPHAGADPRSWHWVIHVEQLDGEATPAAS